MERLERGAGGGSPNLNPEIQDILFTLRPKTFFKAIKLFFLFTSNNGMRSCRWENFGGREVVEITHRSDEGGGGG